MAATGFSTATVFAGSGCTVKSRDIDYKLTLTSDKSDVTKLEGKSPCWTPIRPRHQLGLLKTKILLEKQIHTNHQ